ncbi:receptor-like protein 34 [Camellia sinensis]|uniref:receptor-like protein 34 n=1 Tax=Camellia sinensis TaxID=4442 RepID=UPI0010369616|nr:receptor-like protein 34 [Camellia sinensis]
MLGSSVLLLHSGFKWDSFQNFVGSFCRFYSSTKSLNIDLSDKESKRRLFNRLLYRRRQRGFLELDLILGKWVEDHINSMDENGIKSLVDVLDLSQAHGMILSISASGKVFYVAIAIRGFQGEIPHEMGRLFKLQVLVLTSNSLEGRIPANLSNCNDLRSLHLGNKFIGNLPKELGSLSQLVLLYIDSNNLTGAIPTIYANLSSLERFLAHLNMLEGSILESLGGLKSLTYLSIFSNKLSGVIPSSIYNISSLIALEAPSNLLEGSLPQNLGLTLPNVEVINIWGNQFSGSIPFSISNASKLKYLDLSLNKFSLGVAINFGNPNNLS